MEKCVLCGKIHETSSIYDHVPVLNPNGHMHVHAVPPQVLEEALRRVRRRQFYLSSKFWVMVTLLLSVVNCALCAWGAAGQSWWLYLYFVAVEILSCWAMTEIGRR